MPTHIGRGGRTAHLVSTQALRLLSVVALLVSSLSSQPGAPIAHADGLADKLAPQTSAAVQSQGGPVLHSVTAYGIYWKQVDRSALGQTFYYEAPRCYGPGCLTSYGTDKNYEDRTGTFLQDVGGSPWYGTLSQYWDTDQNGQQVPIFDELALAGTWEDNRDYPNLGRGLPAASLQPGDLQAEIAAAVQHNGWQIGPGSLFFVYLPEEVQACSDTGFCTNVGTSGSGCGFHATTDVDGQRVTYAVIPSPGDTSGCDATVTSPSNDLTVDNAINAEAHELAEAVTNSTGRGWSDPVANLSADGGEVGDKCEYDFPGRGSAAADGSNTTINGHDYILQSLWSDLDNSCTLGRVAVPYLDHQGIQTLQVENGSPGIQVTGHSFVPTSAVQWNGTAIPTTYISSQVLLASVPAGALLHPGAATLTVTQSSTTGGTSNPQIVYIAQPGATLTDSTIFTNFGGTASIGSTPTALTVTSNGGSGTLGLAQFSGNPAGGDTAGGTSAYFALYASPDAFSSLSIQDCALNGGSQVDFFTPSGWRPASHQTYSAATGCATVTVDGTTAPSLTQLQGVSLSGWSPSSTPASAPAPARSPAPTRTPVPNGTGATSPTVTIDDTDPGLSYTGSGWAAYANRPAAWGDLNNDVHATTNNGDTVSYTFKGTGIAYVSEKSDGYGTVQVSLDGVVQTVVDANAPGVHNQGGQTLYSASGLPLGQHTLTLEKTGGAYLLLDALVVQTAAGTGPAANVHLTNDTDAAFTYAGSGWGYYNGRPASVYDIQNDVHATTNNGDSVSYTFTGTGVAYVSEKSDGYGLVDVYLDGALQATVDANASGVHNAGGQILYGTTGLSAGQHTIKLVKKSGAYLLVDAFSVQP